MPGLMIPGRPIAGSDMLSRREMKAEAAHLIKSVKDPATRKALRFLIQRMDSPIGPNV